MWLLRRFKRRAWLSRLAESATWNCVALLRTEMPRSLSLDWGSSRSDSCLEPLSHGYRPKSPRWSMNGPYLRLSWLVSSRCLR